MRRLGIIVVVLAALATALTFSSCTKKREASKPAENKEASQMTPEESKRLEQVKKGVEESKNIIIARVNGNEITMYHLVKEMNALAPKLVPPGQPATPEMTAKLKERALNSLIFKELAIQEAIKEGLRVEPEAVEDVISKIKAQVGSEEAYKKYLEEHGMTEAAFGKIIERSRLFEGITAGKIYNKIVVDDKALHDAYEKDKAFFVTKDNPPRQLSFEEVKGFLERRIKSERGEKKIAQWDKELRKKATIEVLPER